ncbi:hypothetical protein KR054_011080 [Drosophila jambulina]|nr:hypothetical protein KR054_011080 [Drosophila jambulina]
MFWIPLIVCLGLGAKPTVMQFLEPNCGRMDQRALRNRGYQAHVSESPWMAFLHADGKFHCGGSLINHRYVLTAYHCINHGETLTVRLGEYDTSTNPDCSGSDCIPPYEEFEVDKAIRNKEYFRANRFHDIALLRLSREVEYKGILIINLNILLLYLSIFLTLAHIKPICLITDMTLRSRVENMQQFVATGWGSSTSGSPSRTLKSIHMDRLDRSVCRERYLVECNRDQICVGHETGVSCMGDSGGPMGHMVRLRGQEVFVQVGIVSYGNPECRSPSVFTDVMGHMGWIQFVLQTYP